MHSAIILTKLSYSAMRNKKFI